MEGVVRGHLEIGQQLQKILGEEGLTAQEEVLLKDSWNKWRAWETVAIEAFVERLCFLDPSAALFLGGLGDEVEEIFEGLFDLAIRQLQPHTEALGREAACPIHLDPSVQWRSVREYARWFALLGLRAEHWQVAKEAWLWTLGQIASLEEYERGELQKGARSAFARFFAWAIEGPMLAAVAEQEAHLEPPRLAGLSHHWRELYRGRFDLSEAFADLLRAALPGALGGLGEGPLLRFAGAFLQAFDLLLAEAHDLEPAMPQLQELGRVLLQGELKASEFRALEQPLAELFRPRLDGEPALEASLHWLCEKAALLGSVATRHEQRLLAKARDWLAQMAQELGWDPERCSTRLAEIAEEVRDTGTYSHRFEELEYGARVAWRNASRCIGRVSWERLIVRDRRELQTPEAIMEEVLHHLELASFGEHVEAVMTVFRPKDPLERWGPRFWNAQYIRYAGYRFEGGVVMGDQGNWEYGQKLRELGWQPPQEPTPFDLLPLVLQLPGQPPHLAELPPEKVREVPLEHPDFPAFASLGLKWCAIPVICNIGLDLGGLRYTCAPFNGWFIGTEIARDLFDGFRYDKAEEIARCLGLNTDSEQSLWRDRAFLELNVAVLHSFQKARITLLDHHTASRQFLTHDRREKMAGRECPARWSWIVPPLGGSTCEVFHHEMREFHLEPSYRKMAPRWQVESQVAATPAPEETAGPPAIETLIAFGSEAGTAEGLAFEAARRLKSLQPQVMALEQCRSENLEGIQLLLVLISTTGNGNLPKNAEPFARWLEQQPDDALRGISYGVIGLGNRIYEHYCAAGVYLNQLMQDKGGYRFIPLHKADELRGQRKRFGTWIERIARALQLEGQAEESPPKLQLRYLDQAPAHPPAQTRWASLPVLENEPLVKDHASHRAIHSLVLGAGSLSYQVGEYLSVYPDNPPALVDELCQLLKVEPEAWFDIEGGYIAYPLPTTARQVLGQELELSLLGVGKKLLELLHRQATEPSERERLAVWLHSASHETGRALMAQFGDLCGLLRAFPSASLGLEQLLAVLPRQRARLYSISSSPELQPERIALTLGVLEIPLEQGKSAQGLCSSFLAQRSPGDAVRALVRPSDFAPPDDPSLPMLWVAAGTGIAPFVGFLEHRQAWLSQGLDEQLAGPIWLYFGCRDESELLYGERWQEALESGLLSRMEVAYSRDSQAPKTYVQDRMDQDPEALWEFLGEAGCRVYICGDPAMAQGVEAAMLRAARNAGGLDEAEAAAWWAQSQERIFTDVWSSAPQTRDRSAIDGAGVSK